MKKLFAVFFFVPVLIRAQNVGIGTLTPAEKLEIKNPVRSTLKLSSAGFNDTTQLLFSNRDALAQGTDIIFSSNRENGLRISSKSDLAGNIYDSIMQLTPQGRVGINNTNPQERLDIRGNMNITGAIKVNNNSGTSGQVLRSNGDGTMSWDNICEYKNFVTLNSSGSSSTWVVPAGVTKILIEAWGAGGGGNVLAGGGGGGYVRAYFTVAPADVIQYQTGVGGAGAVSATATTGQNSVFVVGAVNLNAVGGQGALFLTSANGQGGIGGGFNVTPSSFNNYIGLRARPGESQERSYSQYDATTFYESGKAGRGGNAANTDNTGGLGQTYLYNTTGAALVFRNGNPAIGSFPGGGGASGVQFGTTNISGGAGADGTVIIHY